MYENQYNKAVSDIKATKEYKDKIENQLKNKHLVGYVNQNTQIKKSVKPFTKWIPGITVIVCIVILIVIGKNTNILKNINNISNGNYTDYPYSDSYEYIEHKLGSVVLNGIEHKFEQINNHLAEAIDFNQGNTLHSFYPEINPENRVSFSRNIDDADENDEVKMNKVIEFGGNNTLELLRLINNLPEHQDNSLDCNYTTNNGLINSYSANLRIYNNCEMSMYVMDNFNWTTEQNILNNVSKSKNYSIINGTNVKIQYVYQQRIYTPNSIMEERYKYFGYFEYGGKKYLICFTSNYTKQDKTDTALGDVPVESQEKCRQTFCEILDKITKNLSNES